MGIKTSGGGGTTITGPAGLEVWRLLSFEYAIRLEERGMRHSSGRSMRKAAALFLGLRPMAKADVVMAAIQARLTELRSAVAAENAAGI